jgi:hypothetical protein
MESARLRDEASAAQPESTTTVAPSASEAPAEISINRKPEEIVLCSGTGELLYEWQAKNVDRRIQLLDLISNIVLSFAKVPLLARGERLRLVLW